MIIHVSDILSVMRCPRKAWEDLHHPEQHEILDHHANRIVSFSTLWESYLNVPIDCQGFAWQTNEESKAILEEHQMGSHIRFEYDECRTKIPFLKKNETGWTAYYPVLSHSAKDQEKDLMAFNYLIAKKAGFEITKHYMVFLDENYERHGDLIPQQLFRLTSRFSTPSGGFKQKTIQEMVMQTAKSIDLDKAIETTKKTLEEEQPSPRRTRNCTAPKKCRYYESCFHEQELPDDSSMMLTSNAHRDEMQARGIARLKDIPADMVNGLELQYAQIMADRLGGRFVDQTALKTWLDQLVYPYCFLDFEWDTFAFPPYDGMKPFDVLCFQYSLHIQNENGILENKSFFGSQDCRRQFIESLLEDMPEKGSIIVFNMEGAEKLRLIQLARQFPEYEEKLMDLTKRMVDLALVFDKGLFYDVRQRGHYSLKTMLPIFSKSTGYGDLEISDGLEAVRAYREFPQADENKKEEIAEAINEYCSMDTYAEVIILDKLKKIVEGEKDHA